MKDSGGFFANPFGFVIEPKDGKAVVSMEGVNESIALQSITLIPYDEHQSYKDYIAELKNSVGELKEGTGTVKLEGEMTSNASSNGVYPVEDRTSPLTSPSDTSRVMLNTIGTEKWSTAGQWVEYRFKVDGSGMYEIYSRYKQSYLDGMYVCRSLQLFNKEYETADQYKAAFGTTAGYYDGVPFAEAAELRYDYGDKWQVTNLTTGVDAEDRKSVV